MSDSVIISVENLGKKYRIRHQAERQRYVALRDVIAEKAKGLFGRRKTEDGSRGAEDGDRKADDGRQKPDDRSRTTEAGGQPDPSSVLRPPPSGSVPSSVLRPPSSEDFWALKGVSFEVRQGEVVGIIGPPRE